LVLSQEGAHLIRSAELEVSVKMEKGKKGWAKNRRADTVSECNSKDGIKSSLREVYRLGMKQPRNRRLMQSQIRMKQEL
jgi:hypothetical protein